MFVKKKNESIMNEPRLTHLYVPAFVKISKIIVAWRVNAVFKSCQICTRKEKNKKARDKNIYMIVVEFKNNSLILYMHIYAVVACSSKLRVRLQLCNSIMHNKHVRSVAIKMG